MNLQDAYYEQRFEISFLRTKGDEFQSFFEKLMGFAYKADFIACRPWGKEGDRKNDGFLKSEKRLFQVYAPNEMEAKKAIAKISADFEGAKVHWGNYFDRWVFVHNSSGKLPPHIHELLLRFEQNNGGITLEPWGLEELRRIFRLLSTEDKAAWFGLTPTEQTKSKLGFSDLRIVIESLSGKAAPISIAVKVVPPGKIEANDLSESIAVLLKSGIAKAPLVSDFFDRWHDETLGERLATAFRTEYRRMQGTMHPNRIFSELQEWVGGSQLGTPEHQMAVLAIMAYYFERCDIFEEPKGHQP